MTRAGERRLHPAVIAALLALVTSVAFLPALRCGFVSWDDPRGRPAYAIVLRGISGEGIAWALRQTDYFAHWMPLTVVSYMLDFQLFGERASGHHLTSVVLHIATVLVVFALWWVSTRRVGAAAAAALLWGIHPLRVEPVVWLAARNEVLSTGLGVLSLLLYAQWTRRRSALPYAASVLALLLALLAKAMALTVPALMLLLDVWPLRRLELPAGDRWRERWRGLGALTWWRRVGALVREKIPFLTLAVAAGAVAIAAKARTMSALEQLPPGERVATAFVALAAYLGNTLWPARLSAMYPLPASAPPSAVIAGAVVLVAVLTAGALAAAWRAPWLTVGWLWFLVALLPVLGLVQAGEQARADRYTYLPEIGLFAGIVFGVCAIAPARRSWPALATGAVVCIALGWMLLTRAQIATWRDSRALFTHMIELDDENYVGHLYLGPVLMAEGKVDDAIAHYQRALAIRPDLARGYTNLAVALAAKGDAAGARRALEQAIRLQPSAPLPHRNLGMLAARVGDRRLAMAELEEALRLDPADGEARRAIVLLRGQAPPAGRVEPTIAAPTAAPRAPYPP